ncbi:MAG: hypothetical protein ABSB56_05605 [Nitrososphaerales archaeon]
MPSIDVGGVDLYCEEKVPKAEAVRVPRARHFPHMENPEFFSEKVLASWRERDD